LLAPVSVREDGVEINIGGPRPRAVLSLLLLNGNRRLSAERIVDALWDEPPKSARNSVQRFIADLRSSNDELAGRVHSDRGGYTFNVAPGELDLDRFAAAVSRADEYRTAHRSTEEASALRVALDEWSGSPIEGIGDPPFALPERTRLNDTRLNTFERWVDAEMTLGHSHDVIAVLEVEAAANPFRERIWAQLISALYRSQRQADALAAYATLRDTLLEELGVDPAPELRELELQVLNQELAAGSPVQTPRSNAGVGLRGYELGELIAESHDGRVLKARQVSTGRDVAVKVIDAATADDPPFIRAFDEANKGVAGLEHPHIVPCTTGGENRRLPMSSCDCCAAARFTAMSLSMTVPAGRRLLRWPMRWELPTAGVFIMERWLLGTCFSMSRETPT